MVAIPSLPQKQTYTHLWSLIQLRVGPSWKILNMIWIQFESEQSCIFYAVKHFIACCKSIDICVSTVIIWTLDNCYWIAINRGVFRTQLNICDEVPSYMFDWFRNNYLLFANFTNSDCLFLHIKYIPSTIFFRS